jgi:hypothetical protein
MDQILLGVQEKADKSNVEYFLYDTGSLQAFLRGLEFFFRFLYDAEFII